MGQAKRKRQQQVLLFAFPDSDVYDAGTAEKYYSNAIQLFDENGKRLERLTSTQRRKIREQKAATFSRPPPTRKRAAPHHEGWELNSSSFAPADSGIPSMTWP